MVRATGVATINNGVVDIARDKAIENALRSAVEEKIGVMIKSYTEVENYELKMDQILSESKGFVNSYRIVSEGREGNTYKVVIDAEVGVGKLEERMEALALIMTRKSKPRIMILMGGDPSKVAPVESAMIKYFTAQGFPVVDAAVARGSFDITTLANSRELATKVAHQYAAEVIIVGQLDVANRSFKLGDVEVTSAEVTLSGKAINGDTGSVIASHSVSKKGEWVKVSEETASLLAKQLKEKLVNAWSRELTNVQ